MSFVDSIASGFRNYANFKGQASRAEFWNWVLFVILLGLVLGTIESIIWPVAPLATDWMQALDATFTQPTPLTNVANLILFVPGLAITARRFHDAGFSAKWLYLLLIPVVYSIFAILGVLAISWSFYTDDVPTGAQLPMESWMTIIFLVAPIFALGVAVFVIHVIFALKPSRSFYDGNKYVEPTPLASGDEGTTA
ncbi:MAG: hypothetical protein RL068_763 [Actinomycetota bacterium]|jgi:uncharacterized membrane protein YhaH (DUF805 family)